MSSPPPQPASRLPVDAEAIRALADILLETGLTEIEIAEGDSRIRVKRAPAVMQAAVAHASPVGIAGVHASGVLASVAQVSTAHSAEMEDGDFAKHPGAVKSPMVGIAYLSPEPGAPVFVNLGQAVSAGQTLLLIEAMKTFNQIKAPRAGTLTRILISPGIPVEYGEVLMVID